MSKQNRKSPAQPTGNTGEQHHSNVQAIKSVFGSALSEDVGEIEELSNGQPPVEAEPAAPKKRKATFRRNFYMTVGAIVLIMAVVGFISTISFGIQLAKNIVDNTAAKNEFASFIYPVVVIDPPPFDSSSQLPETTMLSAAIWNIILNEDKSKYPVDSGQMTVPELDVEKSVAELFGTGLKFTHQTLGDIELYFNYDAETKSYTVPTTPRYLPYSPYVESLTREGDTYTLLVGYLPPGPQWLGNANEKYTPKPVKHMEYVVTKKGSHYTLIAINDKSALDDQTT